MEGAPLTKEQILACARYEFHQGKPVEEAYKNFCKTMGNDAMTYRDFDFWFYRFKNGEFDLDYDRNEDPKKPELLDFPVDVVEKVIGKLALKEKLVLRNVSKSIREVVDNMKHSFRTFKLVILNKYSVKIFNFGKCEEVKWENWKQSLKDLVIMMNWPKMKMKCLWIDIDLNEQDSTLLLEAFKSFNHRIPVAEFDTYPQRVDQVLAVLPYLKPGILEDIIILGKDYGNYMNFNEIVKLDQWKQAKHCNVSQVEELPIECLFHFESIRIDVRRMSVEDVEKLKNALFASPKFEFCLVLVDDEDDEKAIVDAFEDEVIPIPETNQLFEIEFGGEEPTGAPFTFAFNKYTA